MKTTIFALLIIATVIPITLHGDEAAGFLVFSETPGEDSAPLSDPARFVEIPLDEQVAFSGSVVDSLGDKISAKGAFWKVDQFVYSGSDQSRHFYVEIVTGSAAGSRFDIVSNSGNELTLDLGDGDLSGLSAGDEIRVVSKWSLDLLFPDGGDLTPSFDSVAGTEIRFPVAGPGGVEYTGSPVFQYRADLGRWVDASDPTTDAGPLPIEVGTLFSIRQPNIDPLEFLFSGFQSKSNASFSLDVFLAGEEVPDLPEISVEQPVDTILIDGSSNLSFGSVETGMSNQRVFTIRNDGTADLTALSTSIDGTNQADFIAGALSATTLAPGATATVTVTFSPVGTGSRTAALHIASNDDDENPFDIALGGTGTAPAVVLEAPSNVTGIGGEGQVQIAWDAANGATRYEVYRSTSADNETTVLLGSTILTTFIDSTGTIGVDYHYFVKAKDGGTSSDFSSGAIGTADIVPSYRPDNLVGKKSGTLIGNNVYSTGSGQEVKQTSKKSKKLTWYFAIQNDGNVTDLVASNLTKANKDFKTTLKTASGANVTAAAIVGTLQTQLGSGHTSLYKFEVKPTKKTKDKAKKRTFNFTTVSANSASVPDAARAKAQTKK